MTHKEVIAALRSTPSRSKRDLLDRAADAIEKLSASQPRLVSVKERLPMELKPCPKCGKRPYIYKERYGLWRVFHHDICAVHYEKKRAIEEWNRRVGEEETK